MEEVNEKILWEGYGLRYHGGIRTRTGLVCKTDKGPRELKKARGHTASIRFANDVKECLYYNGFTCISRFYSTTEGQPYYIKDGTLYVLEEILPPASLEEATVESFVRGTALLGRMHCCGKGINGGYAPWDERRLPLQFEKRRIELAKIKRRIQRQGGYDAIDLLVIECYDTYMEKATLAENLLTQANYSALVQAAEAKGTFCHHSFKGENLRQGENEALYVGGFESCGRDIPLLDLAAYLKRYMKKTDGGEAGILAMLNAYGEICPLSKGDLAFLRAQAVYPEKFLRLINEYYNKRRACVSPAMQERLAAAVEEERKSGKLAAILEGIS